MNNPFSPLSLTLRVALAFAFLVPGITAFIVPDQWLSFIPNFLMNVLGNYIEVFGYLFGLFEITVASGILLLKDPRIPAGIAVAVLGLIVIMRYDLFFELFRDLSIAGLGIALIVLHTPTHKNM